MQDSKPDDDGTNGDEQSIKLTRRSVLTTLASAGGAAALVEVVDGDVAASEEISLGGNSRESLAAGHRYGSVSLAPSTIRPEEAPA